MTATRVIAHGFVGGAVARINGGQFAQGFVSGAFTKSVSRYVSNPLIVALQFGAVPMWCVVPVLGPMGHSMTWEKL